MSHFKHNIVPIEDITPYERNPRTHSEKQINQLIGAIKEFGFTNPVLIDEDNSLIAGHGRLEAAQRMGLNDVPAVTIEGLDDDQRRALVIADNKLALSADWDTETLVAELQALGDKLELAGFDQEELEALILGNPQLMGGVTGAMTDDFIQPPFSILDARKGDWIERKKKWKSYIRDFGETREGLLGESGVMMHINSGVNDLQRQRWTQ